MKRKYLLIALLSLVLVTGCNNSKTNTNTTGNQNTVETPAQSITTKCTVLKSEANYSIDSEYIIYSTGEKVEKVETVEVVSSESEEVLKGFEQLINQTYENNNNAYGGYDYSVVIDGGTLTSTTTIDYTNMDLSKYVQDNPSMAVYVDDEGYLILTGVKLLYQSMGARCQ